jgi:formylglycine-generating enzyme required for sulfatase activity
VQHLRIFGGVLCASLLLSGGCRSAKPKTDYAGTSIGAVTHSDKAENLDVNCPVGMVLIPAGPTRFGPVETKDVAASEKDQAERLVMRAFCIDKYEYPNQPGEAPMRSVTWMEARDLCTNKGKRLCSEQEFEKACRGPVATLYTYGDGFAAGACPASAQEYASGQYANCVSGFGVADMSGGVYEWTSSSSGEDSVERYLRGGMSADNASRSARCTYRVSYRANVASREVGFRCCTSVQKEEPAKLPKEPSEKKE